MMIIFQQKTNVNSGERENDQAYFVIFIECNFLFSTIFSERYCYKLRQFQHNQQIGEKNYNGAKSFTDISLAMYRTGYLPTGTVHAAEVVAPIASAHWGRASPRHESLTLLWRGQSSSCGAWWWGALPVEKEEGCVAVSLPVRIVLYPFPCGMDY